MQPEMANELKVLQQENVRLKKMVAELAETCYGWLSDTDTIPQ